MFYFIYSGWSIQNFIVDGNSQTSIRGIDFTSGYHNIARNCLVKNCTNNGISSSGDSVTSIFVCEVTACSGSNGAVVLVAGGSITLEDSYVHANTVTGVYCGGAAFVSRCIIAGNTGASDGIYLSTWPVWIRNCTIYGNGRHGIYDPSYWILNTIVGNIITGNGGYGINAAIMTPSGQDARCDYNAFYNNTSGARNIVLAGDHDVTLTGDPFMNAAAGDFSLNSTAGAGAACRGAGPSVGSV